MSVGSLEAVQREKLVPIQTGWMDGRMVVRWFDGLQFSWLVLGG